MSEPLTRADVVARKWGPNGDREVVVKATGEVIGRLRRVASHTGRDVLWDIIELEEEGGHYLTWRPLIREAIEVVLIRHSKNL